MELPHATDLPAQPDLDSWAGHWDAEPAPRPPPLRDGVPLKLSYSDHRWPGCVITENTAIDGSAGLLMWWRHVEPGEDDQDLPQASGNPWHWGGCWNISEIVGVRYTTMFGDPGREFLQSGGRRTVALSPWDLTVDRVGLLVVNPLSITFALSVILVWQLYEIFPQQSGLYDMGRPAYQPALRSSIGTAFACAMIAAIALWWLGLFSYCVGTKYKATHLSPKTTTRWWWQKGFSELTLEVFIGLCVVAIVMCMLTEVSQEGESCHDRLSDAGRRLATTCIKQVGVNQTCGVNGCQCGILSDLLCDEPPLPAHICVKVARPLCAAAGTNVPTSGMHGHLFNILLASIVLCVFNFLNWMVNAWAMLLHWMGYQMRNSQVLNTPVKPDVQYHRFTVMFESPAESLIFNVDSSEDPEAVACMLAGFDDP
ncbi:unnamed protein product [Effrenium voratum]|uniref:Uncharacterized protein n=1 Tax=Effrenium voratum TaxID=2562239 RepID=A0AA36N341_9DINO|nr:unnamed protein product [Effrenium voratum]|mmetsp:Transcript_133057/g.315380  ORF Transcript_133057/g.315380 Transcript_133057/m.315380 type:complete len:425 (-) Transcript_133057:143-1417(-)